MGKGIGVGAALPRSVSRICERANFEGVVAAGQQRPCRRHQQHSKAKMAMPRQRHNATQTTQAAAMQPANWRHHSYSPHGCPATTTLCYHGHGGIDAMGSTTDCFQRLQRCTNSASGCMKADVSCHCHIMHHCHHYSTAGDDATAYAHRNGHGSDRRSHHRQYQQRHLPASATKSSISSDEPAAEPKPSSSSHHAHRHRAHGSPTGRRRRRPTELDVVVATTDDNSGGCNSSTGTSIFSYKIARSTHETTATEHGRRPSVHSNTTIETSELSADESHHLDDLLAIHADVQYHMRQYRADERPASPSAAYCEDAQCARLMSELTSPSVEVQNENVKIRRKRFASQQSCSLCSRCSSNSCRMRTSSCSSVDDMDDMDMDLKTLNPERRANAVTVVAECHRCNLQRQSTRSTIEEYEVDGEGTARERPTELALRPQQPETADTQSQTSHESFCSCNSASCCYCSCSCDDDNDNDNDDNDENDGQRTERPSKTDTPMSTRMEADEPHSSTLTPITNPSSMVSTPLADDAATLRSASSGLDEDSGSRSQSAEYFSLSSNQPSFHQQESTAAFVVQAVASDHSGGLAVESKASRPSLQRRCRHAGRHRGHKSESPIDSSL